MLALLRLFEVSEVSLPETACYSQGCREEEGSLCIFLSEHNGLKTKEILNNEITVRELILKDSRVL